MPSRIVFSLLLLTFPSSVFALNPHKAITQYVHDVWQVENGLPGNVLFAVAQTPEGYIWMGTEKGIVRFDGVNFVIFDKSNTSAIRNNYILCLLVDRKGTLWAGSRGGGLIRYENS